MALHEPRRTLPDFGKRRINLFPLRNDMYGATPVTETIMDTLTHMSYRESVRKTDKDVKKKRRETEQNGAISHRDVSQTMLLQVHAFINGSIRYMNTGKLYIDFV